MSREPSKAESLATLVSVAAIAIGSFGQLIFGERVALTFLEIAGFGFVALAVIVLRYRF